MKGASILFIVICILIALQTSFFVHFKILGVVPNLILIFVLAINFLERPERETGLLAAVLGGFFMDIFSIHFLGFYILILLAAAIFIKFVLRKHVRIPIIQKY